MAVAHQTQGNESANVQQALSTYLQVARTGTRKDREEALSLLVDSVYEMDGAFDRAAGVVVGQSPAVSSPSVKEIPGVPETVVTT